MVRHLATICLIYFSLVLQSTFANELTIQGFRTWFPGIALVACVLLHNGVASLLWAALLGLSVDALSAERMGFNVTIVTFVATGLLLVKHDFRTVGAISTGVFVLSGTVTWRMASLMTLDLFNEHTLPIPQLVMFELRSGILTAMLAMGFVMVTHVFRNGFRRQGDSSSTVLTNQWSMLTR